MKMSKPNNLSQRSKSARGRASHYLRFGLSALLLQSSLALAEASESSENSADEALIEPCDPFTDSTCSNRVELGNGQTFEGRLKQGKPHGRGMMFYPNGDRFEGHFDLGARTGRGTLFKADGSLYSGFLVRDRLNGAVEWRSSWQHFSRELGQRKTSWPGRMLFVNGDRYTGEFAMGLPHGEGSWSMAVVALKMSEVATKAGLSGVSAKVLLATSGTMGRCEMCAAKWIAASRKA